MQVEQSEFRWYIVSVVVTDTRLMSVFHLFCYLPDLCVRIYVPAMRCHASSDHTTHTFFFAFRSSILHNDLNSFYIHHWTLKLFCQLIAWPYFLRFFCSAALPLLSFPASSSSSLSSGGITTAIYYTSTHPLLTY